MEESLADARAAVAIDPTYVKGFYRQATALLALKRPQEAFAAAQAGLQLQPSNAQMAELKRTSEAQISAMRGSATAMQADDDDDDEEEDDEEDSASPMETESPFKPPAVSAASAAERAEASKEEGNRHYKAGDYERASVSARISRSPRASSG